MATANAGFRFFILGLLAKRPMSGYDIRRLLRSLGWLLGNPSFGTIYPALHALRDDGLVTVEVVAQPSRPARKIYTITEIGERALQEWVKQPPPSSIGLKTFVMHLILAGDSSPAKLTEHLRQRYEAVAAHHSALEQAVEGLGEQVNAGELLAIEYGLAIADAELSWLEGKTASMAPDAVTDPVKETT